MMTARGPGGFRGLDLIILTHRDLILSILTHSELISAQKDCVAVQTEQIVDDLQATRWSVAVL